MTIRHRKIRPAIGLLLLGSLFAALVGASPAPASSHSHDGTDLTARQVRRLAGPLARARAATAKYATDPELAKADGYDMTITQMIPDMGYHLLNPDIIEFDVTRPPILVYARNGNDPQLVAFEWVFPEKPASRPLPGASYGSFPAACHYEDGTFTFSDSEPNCAATSPESGAAFTFWHPKLITLHVWAWYPNPAGIFSGTNRWIRPFNDDQV
jgi:hypothetical protein